MHPHCQNWCIAAKKDANDSSHKTDIVKFILLKMVKILRKKNCIMNDIHFPQLCIPFSLLSLMCIFFRLRWIITSHLQTFFLPTRQTTTSEITLCIKMSAVTYGGKCILKLFEWIFPTYNKPLPKSRSLIEFIIFIDIYLRRDCRKRHWQRKKSHQNGSAERREKETEWERWLRVI